MWFWSSGWSLHHLDPQVRSFTAVRGLWLGSGLYGKGFGLYGKGCCMSNKCQKSRAIVVSTRKNNIDIHTHKYVTICSYWYTVGNRKCWVWTVVGCTECVDHVHFKPGKEAKKMLYWENYMFSLEGVAMMANQSISPRKSSPTFHIFDQSSDMNTCTFQYLIYCIAPPATPSRISSWLHLTHVLEACVTYRRAEEERCPSLSPSLQPSHLMCQHPRWVWGCEGPTSAAFFFVISITAVIFSAGWWWGVTSSARLLSGRFLWQRKDPGPSALSPSIPCARIWPGMFCSEGHSENSIAQILLKENDLGCHGWCHDTRRSSQRTMQTNQMGVS